MKTTALKMKYVSRKKQDVLLERTVFSTTHTHF